MSFTPLNYLVLGVYLAAMVAIGAWFAGRQRTTEDFFLAGRRLPWLPVAMSFYASVTSANTYLGLPGITYARNTALIVVSLMSPLVAPVLIALFYPFYRRWRVTTSYEYAELRFGRPARLAASGLFLLARVGWLGMVVYAPSLALSAVTGLPLWASILLMGFISTAYTLLGGLAAVVWTDVAQFLIMFGGAVALAVLLPREAPGGIAAVWREARAAGKLVAFDLRWNVAEMTGLAVAVSYFLKLMYEYGADQISVQRLLAVRTRRGLARAICFNAATDVVIIGLLSFIGLGLFAWVRNNPGALPPNLKPDQALPYYIVHRFPDGVSGLLITAVFAAAMSSVDSGINSVSSALINDFIRPARPGLSEKAGLRLARALTLALGIFATAMAFWATRIGGIVRAFLTIMGLFAAPVLALFLLGMLNRNARFFAWAIGAAAAFALTLAARHYGAMDEIFFFPFSFSAAYAIGWLLSQLAPKPPPRPGLTVWDRELAPAQE